MKRILKPNWIAMRRCVARESHHVLEHSRAECTVCGRNVPLLSMWYDASSQAYYCDGCYVEQQLQGEHDGAGNEEKEELLRRYYGND